MSYTTKTDEALAISFSKGDIKAYETIVYRYENELFAFIMHFMRDTHETDDVFQNTCLQLYKSIDKYNTERRFKPWLFTMAANKARDRLRQKKRQFTHDLDAPISTQIDSQDSFASQLESSLPNPQQIIGQEEFSDTMRNIVDKLKPIHKEILLLSYFHEFNNKEISHMLNVPISTVKGRLHIALKHFSQHWQSYLETQPK